MFADYAPSGLGSAWTTKARNARIDLLRRRIVTAPDVLYSITVRGEAFDVVWDGSVRAPFPCAAEPGRVD